MKKNGNAESATKLASLFLALALMALAAPGASPAHRTFGGPGPQNPSDFNADLEMENLILKIDGALMARHIQELQDFGTRYSYRGDRCFEVARYINATFSNNGLAVYYDDFSHNGWDMRNVVGVKPGLSDSNGTVIICGHYDSTSSGSYPWTMAPGADDNGSGAAAVMAAAELLSDYGFNLTVKFIAFSGEEQGLLGSYNYVSGAVAAGENITAVINLDMIAYNPDPGATTVRMYEGGNGDSSWLKSFMADTAAKYQHLIGIQPVDYGRISASDHHPFSSRFQAIHLIEQKYTANPHYHKITDTLDHLNMTYCANVTQLAIAAAAELAEICAGDASPPSHSQGLPRNGDYAPAIPTISIDVRDPGGIDPETITLTVSGTQVAPELAEVPLGLRVSHVPETPLPDGETVNVSVSAADIHGNLLTHNWSFTVDAVPPEPPTNLTITPSRISLVKRGTVLEKDPYWDLKHVLSPSVIRHDGEYKMWYMAANASQYYINYANSSDGIVWVKHGTVLPCTQEGQPDYKHVGYHSVVFDGEYKMWYSGYDGMIWRILYANSTDGIEWSRHGVVLAPGQPGSPDASHVSGVSVIKADGYKMWYTGVDGRKYGIFYADSTDGLNWVKHNESLLPPDGPGRRWGDAAVGYPSVVHDNGTYRMWYNRIGQNYYRAHYAESSDGLIWNDHGLAIGVGAVDGDHDRFYATYCSALVSETETKLWYSGYDGFNFRILFANITPQDPARDLTLSWSPSASSDVVRYELFRESRPSAFNHPLEAAHSEPQYAPPGRTPWAFGEGRETNITVYGPATGSDPPYFHLPDDNILDIDLFMDSGTGGWSKLAPDTDYSIDTLLGHVTIGTPLFGAGCTIHAWYNHSAGRALRAYANTVTDASAAGMDYYYKLRAVDRAGNHAYCASMPGSIGIRASTAWNLLGFPHLSGPTPIGEALDGLDWTRARTWDPTREWPNQWTLNAPGRSGKFDTLHSIDCTVGAWVKVSTPGDYLAAPGLISNVSINLVAGWNLVSYPYLEINSVSEALAGIPWDRAEAFDPTSPSQLKVLSGTDPLSPGQGLWVRVTSDSVWTAVNVP